MKPTICVVTGGRDFSDRALFAAVMESFAESFDWIYTGCANGADAMAREYAHQNNIPLVVFSAEWKRHGKAAGPMRNRAMLWAATEEGVDSFVVAFKGGKGTLNCCKFAEELQMQIFTADWERPHLRLIVSDKNEKL